MAPRRVLVTGGSGFLGKAVVTSLLDAGARVTVADLLPHGGGGVEEATGDLRETRVLDAALASSPDAVVHLAALTSVLESARHPSEVFRTNTALTASLLEGCRQRDIGSFVLASTNAVVGAGARGRIDERSPLKPLTPYGATKAAAEMLVSCYAAAYGMAAGALRFTNVYGPGMAGKDSVVARLMRAALGGGPIQIYGDGEQVRDYLFVEDAASALRLALDTSLTGTLTIGAGHSVSMNELHRRVCAVTGVDIPVEHVAAKEGEMRAVSVDVSNARARGFAPRVTLTEGLEATWRYFADLDRRAGLS